MASIMYDSAHFNHTIDKVAKWMATSDSQVCLFADDTSVSILSSTTPSTNSAREQGRQVLIDRLKCDAVSRIRSLFRSTANQENNHNESKKRRADSRSSSDESPNRNRNNRHGGGSESEHRRKSHSESRHRRQSQPSNSHSVAAQRKDSGDGSGGGAGGGAGGGGGGGGSNFKDDKYLERIVDRATQEIRSAIYKLKAENKLPESCHLKMKLSIKPQRTAGANTSPKESPAEHKRRQPTHDDRRRSSNSGRHRTTEREAAASRSDRDKRATSSSNRHEHQDQKKDRRKSGY